MSRVLGRPPKRPIVFNAVTRFGFRVSGLDVSMSISRLINQQNKPSYALSP